MRRPAATRAAALALAVVLAVVLVLWLRGRGHARVVGEARDGGFQTLEYDGVRVQVPPSWRRLDRGDCEFEFEQWGPATRHPCHDPAGVAFYAAATFDPGTGPGPHRVAADGPGRAAWAGYEEAGDWSVYVRDDSEHVVRTALSSVTVGGHG